MKIIYNRSQAISQLMLEKKVYKDWLYRLSELSVDIQKYKLWNDIERLIDNAKEKALKQSEKEFEKLVYRS